MLQVFIGAFRAVMVVGVVAAFAAPVFSQPFGTGAQQQREAVQPKCLSAQGGRFVFGQVSESGKDQFMLDTHTGRIWRISESGKVGVFLKSVPYCNAQGECSELPGEPSLSKSEGPAKK